MKNEEKESLKMTVGQAQPNRGKMADMKQKSKLSFLMLIVIMLTITTFCNGQEISNNNKNDTIMEQELPENALNISYYEHKGSTYVASFIISETEEYIERLSNIYRDDRRNYGDLPFIGKDDFFIHFDITRKEKQGNAGSSRSYYLHVIPDNGNYKMKSLLESESFYFGEEAGHSYILIEWFDDESWAFVLEFYFEHQSKILVQTDE
jgi:hypothetical protein